MPKGPPAAGRAGRMSVPRKMTPGFFSPKETSWCCAAVLRSDAATPEMNRWAEATRKSGDETEYAAESDPLPGVGSNGSQPYRGNQTSTHACASWSVTVHVFDCGSYTPLVNPSATRAGTPR